MRVGLRAWARRRGAAESSLRRLPEQARLAVSAPPWVWLTGMVLASVLLRFLLARRVEAPWIFVDELIYSELAKSVAATGDFLIRDQPYADFGPLYPLLISPAWRVLSDIPDAYLAAKAINAVAMSLAAVPAYFLARRVIAPPRALLGALLAIAVPSLAYTGTLMTENLAYPLVLTVVFLLVVTLERPTLGRSLALLGACLLAFLTRTQAVVLLAAVAAAPVLLALLRRRLAELRPFTVLYAPMALGTALVVSVQLARGRSPGDFFGAYEGVLSFDYSPSDVLEWAVYHLAGLDLYVGVLPFAAFLLLLVGAPRASAADQAYLTAAAAVTAALIVQVAMFASTLEFVDRVAERYTFYAAPLLLIALLLWIERGLPRPRPAALLAALAAAALPALLPFGRLLNQNATADTLAFVPWLRLRDGGASPEAIRVLVLVASVVAAGLFLRLPRRLATALPALVLAYLVLVLVQVQRQFHLVSNGSLRAVTERGPPDWIDRAVGKDARTSVLWSGETWPSAVWVTEFFNRSASDVYDLGAALPGGLPEEPAHIDGLGVVRDHLDRPVYGPFVLADRSVVVGGVPVTRSRGGELTLYRVDGPVRVVGSLGGRFQGDTWFRPAATYERRPCRDGTLTVTASVDPERFPQGQRVVALVGERPRATAAIPPGGNAVLTVLVSAIRGRCIVTLRATRSAYDPSVEGVVGARYTSFAWR